MENVIIYGAGPYAEVFYYDLIKHSSDWNPVAFVVDKQYYENDNFCSLPVFLFDNIEEFYPPQSFKMFVVCGYTRMRNRKEMYCKAKTKGYISANYISSCARIDGSVKMGENNIVLSGAEIGHDSVLGNNNFINQNCYLAHNMSLGDHNVFSAGCIIGGFSTIGDLNFFGFSATSSGFRRIGNENLIGMGSVLTKDIADYSKVYGNPARLISLHERTGVVIKEGDGSYRYDDKVQTDLLSDR